MDPDWEAKIMGKTIAEAIQEEGALKGKREALLLLLQLKFKHLPPAVTAEIEATQDDQQLKQWLEAFVTADKISDIPFQSSTEP
jgi:hypothetical protein